MVVSYRFSVVGAAVVRREVAAFLMTDDGKPRTVLFVLVVMNGHWGVAGGGWESDEG
jgi:hypothetical protein